MRELFFLLAFVLFISCENAEKTKVNSTQINWYNIEAIENLMDKEPRTAFIMVHADWCPKCAKMSSITYKDPKVIEELNNNFYPILINAHEQGDITFKNKRYGNPNYDSSKGKDEQNAYHEILFELGAESIPSILFMDKDLNVFGHEMGYQEPNVLRAILKMNDG